MAQALFKSSSIWATPTTPASPSSTTTRGDRPAAAREIGRGWRDRDPRPRVQAAAAPAPAAGGGARRAELLLRVSYTREGGLVLIEPRATPIRTTSGCRACCWSGPPRTARGGSARSRDPAEQPRTRAAPTRDPRRPRRPSQDHAGLVAEHGLSAEGHDRVLQILGREPNLLELGIFRSSVELSYNPPRSGLDPATQGPQVIHGPGENAAWSHRRGPGRGLQDREPQPSLLHRALGRGHRRRRHPARRLHHGARPWPTSTPALRRPPASAHAPLLAGVVAGIGGTATASASPVAGGQLRPRYWQHPGQRHDRGPGARDRVFTAAAVGVGNPVIYVGSKTGRDGIHDATMASTSSTRRPRPSSRRCRWATPSPSC